MRVNNEIILGFDIYRRSISLKTREVTGAFLYLAKDP